eukprot:4529862-Prymnesium_polylepis.1
MFGASGRTSLFGGGGGRPSQGANGRGSMIEAAADTLVRRMSGVPMLRALTSKLFGAGSRSSVVDAGAERTSIGGAAVVRPVAQDTAAV